jgi:hypothetical protein
MMRLWTGAETVWQTFPRTVASARLAQIPPVSGPVTGFVAALFRGRRGGHVGIARALTRTETRSSTRATITGIGSGRLFARAGDCICEGGDDAGEISIRSECCSFV